MTWEETIVFAREQHEYTELLKQCYLTEDLVWNKEQYGNSAEFKEILKLVEHYAPKASALVEFGAGNGIASVNFALRGFDVLSSEPDNSINVGTGAIKKLCQHYDLNNITIVQSFAEDLSDNDNKFDIVFSRQCMHHANNLGAFTKNAFRMLKPGGLFLAVRDHVINSETNKQEFLKSHPFHKYYGGENAFTFREYNDALAQAGFRTIKTLRYFDSVINYFPEKDPMKKARNDRDRLIAGKFPVLFKHTLTRSILTKLFELKYGRTYNDLQITGRMYSFIAIK